jgi:hypothetical protein
VGAVNALLCCWRSPHVSRLPAPSPTNSLGGGKGDERGKVRACGESGLHYYVLVWYPSPFFCVCVCGFVLMARWCRSASQ